MPTCTFFGHQDCPETIKPKLKKTLTDLITNHGINTFYVGNHGHFDAYVRSTLKELQQEYPHIRYAIVLAYLPGKKAEYEDLSDTIPPEGIETVPPRFAISWRNKWMIKQSDYVVTYITHTPSNAAQFAEKAERQKKEIICLV